MVFEELEVPTHLKISHKMMGGKGIRRWYAPVADGVLRVMWGREPAGDDDALIGHVSIGVGNDGNVGTPPSRAPTDEECQAALAHAGAQSYKEECSGIVRHFWEE